jgi:RHS repeat-associated protein
VAVDGNPITYDALNRRVEYYNSGVGYVQYLWAPYDPTSNVLIASSSGPQVQLPLPGGGQAMVGPSGLTDYRHSNWQGSQVIDSTPSQTAAVHAAFTPYGEHYDDNNYLGFFGGNLSIYPFFMDGYAATWRLYHYDQGRWISPDPAGLSAVDPSNPQTWNRYAYVAGNPLNSTDPSGLGSCPQGWVTAPNGDGCILVTYGGVISLSCAQVPYWCQGPTSNNPPQGSGAVAATTAPSKRPTKGQCAAQVRRHESAIQWRFRTHPPCNSAIPLRASAPASSGCAARRLRISSSARASSGRLSNVDPPDPRRASCAL